MAANTWIITTGVLTKKIYNVFVSDQVICTTLTNDPSAVTEWINGFYLSRAYLKWEYPGEVVVGVDARARYQRYPFATLALYFGQRCLVYQMHLSNVFIPPALQRFMVDEDIVVAGPNIFYKINKLKREYGLSLKGIRYAETVIDRYRVREFIPEPGQFLLDDWDNIDLSDVQVSYTTFVAYDAYQIAVTELRNYFNQLNEGTE